MRIKPLICKLRDHKYEKFSDGLKRRCVRCNREEWMMMNSHPMVGEPLYKWVYIPYVDVKIIAEKHKK